MLNSLLSQMRAVRILVRIFAGSTCPKESRLLLRLKRLIINEQFSSISFKTKWLKLSGGIDRQEDSTLQFRIQKVLRYQNKEIQIKS